jgi:hypothetical protein
VVKGLFFTGSVENASCEHCRWRRRARQVGMTVIFPVLPSLVEVDGEDDTVTYVKISKIGIVLGIEL